MVESNVQVSAEQAEENLQSVLCELEGLESTLTTTEFQICSHEEGFVKAIKLSLVPNFEGKITARNLTKALDVELRKLPPLELKISLPQAYPSDAAPHVKVVSQFYAPYENLIQNLLGEKWYEGSMGVLYDYSQFI